MSGHKPIVDPRDRNKKTCSYRHFKICFVETSPSGRRQPCGYEYPQVLRRRLPTTELRAEKKALRWLGTQKISAFHLTLLIIDVPIFYFDPFDFRMPIYQQLPILLKELNAHLESQYHQEMFQPKPVALLPWRVREFCADHEK